MCATTDEVRSFNAKMVRVKFEYGFDDIAKAKLFQCQNGAS